ncbi:MAG: ribonuclease P protein component [Methylococcales bacterium]
MDSINCFSRKVRLLASSEYRFVFEKPTTKSIDRVFTILGRRNQSGRARLGLAIAKKHIRKAVDRNKIKRTIRESFRLNQESIGEFDIIVLARAGASTASSKSLHEALLEHWKQFPKSSE